MLIFVINIVSAISQMLIAGTKPVLSLYASKLGATPAEIGIIVSVFAILPAFLAIHIGKWIDRYGMRRLVAIGGIGLLLSVAIPIAQPNYPAFVLSQAVMGVAFTLQIVALQKRIGATPDMDRQVATFSLVGSVGSAIGPGMSTYLYDKFSFELSFLVNAIIVLIGIVLVYLVTSVQWETPDSKPKSEAAGGNPAAGSVWLMLKQPGLRNAVIISGLMLSNREIFVAYFPLLGEQMQLSATTIGMILSAMGIASMAVRLTQASLVRRFGRMNVLTWALYISGAIYLLTPSIPVTLLLTVLIVILGAGLGLGHPLSLAYTIQVSPPERRGEVLGLRITFNRISQFTVPLLFGSIGGVAGIAAIFWASGLMLLSGGWLTRTKRSADEQRTAA